MYKVFVCILFIFIQIRLPAQFIYYDIWLENTNENAWQEYNLKGKVSEIKETAFWIDSINGQKKEVLKYPIYEYKTDLKFDKNGNITFYSSYFENLNGDICQDINEYFYENEILIKEKSKWDKEISISYIKYDSLNRINEVKSFIESNSQLNSGNTITYSYNKNNFPEKIISIFPNGKSNYITEYKYDSFNKLILSKDIFENSDDKIFTYKYSYNENPNARFESSEYTNFTLFHHKIKDQNFNIIYDSVYSDDSSNFYSLTKSEYNKFNDVVKISKQLGNKPDDFYMFEYSYDKFNNWTKKKIYINNRLEYIIDRKIKYHK